MSWQSEMDRCEYAVLCQGGPVAPPLWYISYGRNDSSGMWVCSRHIAKAVRELRVMNVILWPPRGVTR